MKNAYCAGRRRSRVRKEQMRLIQHQLHHEHQSQPSIYYLRKQPLIVGKPLKPFQRQFPQHHQRWRGLFKLIPIVWKQQSSQHRTNGANEQYNIFFQKEWTWDSSRHETRMGIGIWFDKTSIATYSRQVSNWKSCLRGSCRGRLTRLIWPPWLSSGKQGKTLQGYGSWPPRCKKHPIFDGSTTCPTVRMKTSRR